MAAILDIVDIEHSYHHRKFYWTELAHQCWAYITHSITVYTYYIFAEIKWEGLEIAVSRISDL